MYVYNSLAFWYSHFHVGYLNWPTAQVQVYLPWPENHLGRMIKGLKEIRTFFWISPIFRPTEGSDKARVTLPTTTTIMTVEELPLQQQQQQQHRCRERVQLNQRVKARNRVPGKVRVEVAILRNRKCWQNTNSNFSIKTDDLLKRLPWILRVL